MVIWGKLGDIAVGDRHPVAVIGVINLSPDSFFKGSVVSQVRVVERAAELLEMGAQIIDIGAMGTGPKSAPVEERVEMKRLIPAVRAISRELEATISADTQRSRVAEEAAAAGAEIINDISGMKSDPKMAEVVRKYRCSAVLMAADKSPGDVFTISAIKKSLRESLELCREEGISLRKIAVDPGIGFWPARLTKLEKKTAGRHSYLTFVDLKIISKLRELRELGRPICVGISRKSFIGEISGEKDPAKRLPGSLAAAAVAVVNGAHIIRTHDPAETSQAIEVAEALREVGGSLKS